MLGNISGAMGGVPQTLPASMSALCLRSASRVNGDDVAVVEYRVAGDVIEVPMAKDRGEFPNPQLFEIAAHEFRMGHAGEGIVDNGLRAAVDGVHGCAEL